jgi:hypothetical protein
VTNWVLSVELDGEWEECSFATRTEALAMLVALASDYRETLRSVVLSLSRPSDFRSVEKFAGKTYIN